ncbi:MAG: hypothetical protein R3F46_02670 [bacterium]
MEWQGAGGQAVSLARQTAMKSEQKEKQNQNEKQKQKEKQQSGI